MAPSTSVAAYDGPCFVVLAPSGDVPPGKEYGLYYEDTRFLSLHTLHLDGTEPLLLSARASGARFTSHYCTNQRLRGAERGTLVVRRSYGISHGAHCDLCITNFGERTASFELILQYGADFEDVFAIKRSLEAHARHVVGGEHAVTAQFGKSVLALAAGDTSWSRRTEVRLSLTPRCFGRDGRAVYSLEIGPGEAFRLCQDFYTIAEGDFVPPRRLCSEMPLLDAPAPTDGIEPPPPHPSLESDLPALDAAYERAIVDLYALRIRHLEGGRGEFHLAAGVPWFMALFGRDSLVATYQSMPYLPDLARGALRSLAHWQGRREDPETEEQPGKILHENRPGNLVGARDFTPRFPYYGSVDSTPLYVIVLSELWRHEADLDFLRAFEDSLSAAVAWIQRARRAHQDGFLRYRRSTRFGLTNQGWKDSDDSVRFRDGSLGAPPIALIEAQGYACDALGRAAELYRALGRPEAEARTLERDAALLRTAIDRAYWLEDRGYWAMALDGAGRRVDALTSNPAHLLWSGAALEPRAARAAHVLLSPELFSGFGVPTMGREEVAYNPISYHNGSVWPHDTSLAAAGLARYGHREAASRLCRALIDAVGSYDDRRLPELFAGMDRDDAPFPVAYPTANSPQAWAAGAILLAVTVMLGLRIDAPRRTISVYPALPERAHELHLSGLMVAGASLRIDVERHDERTTAHVLGAPAGWTIRTTTDD